MIKYVQVSRTEIATCYGRGALQITLLGEPKKNGLASLFGQWYKVTLQFLEPHSRYDEKTFTGEEAALDYYLMQIIKHTRHLAEIREVPK